MTPVYPKALYIVRLTVENASIVSSHLTWGFPAPSAFVGFTHALQRKLNAVADYQDLICSGVGILCHQFTPQVTQSGEYRYSPYQLNLARHPLEPNGTTPAIVEEGKGHMEVSLIIALAGDDLTEHLSANDDELNDQSLKLIAAINQTIWSMRLAGGAVFPHARVKPKLVRWSLSQAKQKTQKLRRYLLPSFALIHRHELLVAHQKWLGQYQAFTDIEGHADPSLMDSLLDISRLNLISKLKDKQTKPDEDEADWSLRPRPEYLKGWLVPIPIGYGAITDLQAAGSVTGVRDSSYPVAFVETLLSLGEWKSPHRIEDLTETLWAYETQPDQGLYALSQPFAPKISIELTQHTDSALSDEFDETDETEEEEN